MLRIKFFPKHLKLCFSLNLFARYKTFAAQNGEFERFGGLCVDSYNTLSGVKGGKLIFDHSSAKQILTQKFESPGFQIEHQLNWKIDAYSRGIQSKTHLKSKC